MSLFFLPNYIIFFKKKKTEKSATIKVSIKIPRQPKCCSISHYFSPKSSIWMILVYAYTLKMEKFPACDLQLCRIVGNH